MVAKHNLIIINSGDFGREVLVWSRQAIAAGAPWQIKGFLDSRTNTLDPFDCGVPILGSPYFYSPQPEDLFLCALGEPGQKKKYTSLLEAKGAKFATLIHPTALVGERVEIGDGGIIAPFTQLSCDIKLGRHVTIGTMSSGAHDTNIGDYSQISGGCQINGHSSIGVGVFVGSSVTLLPHSRVGDWAYIGAGSVVLRSVRESTKVFGNPAVQIGTAGTIDQ